jgi:hypothetical protein
MVANLSSANPPVKPDAVLELCRMTPKERFQRLRSQGDKANRLIDKMEVLYSEFLTEVQHPEPELLERFANESTRKHALAQAADYGDLIYELLGEVAAPKRLRSLVI